MSVGLDPVVLVIGSGNPVYREYLLTAAARRHPLWLLDLTAPTWPAGHVAGATEVDVFDTGALAAAAGAVAAQRPVAGILCYDEALVLPAAELAASLRLPGPSAEAVRNCRDKHRTRQRLQAAGIAQPGSVPVASLAEAAAAAARIGYPVVLKPRGLGASQGVVRADGPADLEERYAAAAGASYPGVPTYRDGVLVEEYLDGPEISIDAAVVGGTVTPLFVARKRLGPPPYFEEAGHVVDAADPGLTDPELGALLTDVHRALGVRDTITHTEVRFTARGPRVIEVNARLGGDLIPWLGLLATGIDPGPVAVDLATGTRPDLQPTRRRAAGVRFLYPEVDCRVRSAELPVTAGHDGVQRADVLVGPGAELRLPPAGYVNRWAVVVCTAPDAPACAARLDEIAAAARLDAEPLGADAPPPPRPSWHPDPAKLGGGRRAGT